MLHRIFLFCILTITSIGLCYSHSFDEDTFAYILSHPDISWSEFELFISQGDDAILQEEITDIEQKLALVLSLPGKKYIGNYAKNNPDFSYSDINTLISDDPMLAEIGAEPIYNFLISQLRSDRLWIWWDFFMRLIILWWDHILSGFDHILFILTLVVCLPAWRHVFWIVTTFTLAHSVALMLWGFGIIMIPSTVVEPGILISIILMAVYAIYKKPRQVSHLRYELWCIFALWLVHGLGFAGFFGGILGSSENILFPIVWFNIGVELGQIFIICLMLGSLYFLYQYFPNYQNKMKNILCGWCIIMSSVWLGQIFLKLI